MAVKRKLGFGRALLLAASATFVLMGTARAQGPTQDLMDLNTRILENPQDTDLNLQYARAAEQQGKPRLALAAYERVLINDPDNEQAQRGFARVRRVIEPAFQTKRIEIGGRWDSNPTNDSENDDDAWSAFARATVVDERRLGAHRWRTIARFDGELVPELRQEDFGYVGVQVGPIIDVAPHVAAIPAVGVSVASLDDTHYFSEVNAGVTVEGQRNGVSLWGRTRVNYRDYSEESTSNQGFQVEVSGGATAPHVASSRDSVSVVPWARWSGVEGSYRNSLDEESAPGKYIEYGVEANYNYRLNDNISLSGGFIAYQRNYTTSEVAGQDRHDTYLAPQANVMIWNVLPCSSCAINLNYRHRDNRSNDPHAEYAGDQVSISLFAQF